MSDHSTPRRMVKAWVQGEPPSRPLLMPILFAIGARIESLSLEKFQSNPTKITNALRQIRSVMPVDGLSCYFDPVLEINALGYRREWQTEGPRATAVPSFSGVDELRQQLCSPDRLQDKGSIPVACEVLRRVKAMLKDEPVLLIRVNGPIGLARQLCGGNRCDSSSQFLQDLLVFAVEVTASVARTFAEAGADVILLVEDFKAGLPSASFEAYSSLLTPVVNVVRFYEALPVLLLGKASREIWDAMQANLPDCVLCPTWTAEKSAWHEPHPQPGSMAYALTIETLGQDQQHFEALLSAHGKVSASKVCLLTSSEDVPAGLDLKKLAERLKFLREHFAVRPDSRHGLPPLGAPD
jgi:Uroporphyrinogen decarboxylase (URO-D)